MIDRSISLRYSRVLFDLDCLKGNLEQRLIDFDSVNSILNNSPKLLKVLKSPQVSLNDKKKVLHNSLKDTFDPAFINFLSYLIQQGRLAYLKHIGKEYRLLVNEHLKRWEANIITAVPIDRESEEKLMEKLGKVFRKTILLNKEIDPKIVGGAILVMSNKMLDWSVSGRLRKLKDHLIAGL